MSEPKPTNLGLILRKWRVVNEIGVRELAADVGISHATLSRIELGHQMDAQTFLRLMNWMMRQHEMESR